MPAKRSKDERLAYLDLLASTLTEHEKALDALIEKLEKTTDSLVKMARQRVLPQRGEVEVSAVPEEEAPETIIYLKIKSGRSVEELTRILKTLTEK